MYNENNLPLGMIMKYCKENGIDLATHTEFAQINGNRSYGDLSAQTYFTYFNSHKDEVIAWANSLGLDQNISSSKSK